MKSFFDTNVLVYLFDADSPEKRRKARALFQKHAEAGDILLSTQVLQEFYVAVTRKLARPLDAAAAAEAGPVSRNCRWCRSTARSSSPPFTAAATASFRSGMP
ncbi:MAG: PIN domain-containing protein [Burkholderiales bacterium]|nr:PIN domain-containing protein [Burkholderiales bacterium]